MTIFFYSDTTTTQISTLSLHDALPISHPRLNLRRRPRRQNRLPSPTSPLRCSTHRLTVRRSEEHTSELQSRRDLVCRLLLEKKNIQEGQLNLRLHMPQLIRLVVHGFTL